MVKEYGNVQSAVLLLQSEVCFLLNLDLKTEPFYATSI